MSDLEVMLEARETSDNDAKRRVMRPAEQDPLMRWESMNGGRQEELRLERNSAIVKQRDEDGRSALPFRRPYTKTCHELCGGDGYVAISHAEPED